MDAVTINWPKHINLLLEHNPHSTLYYSTVSDYLSGPDSPDPSEWISDEQRKKAIEKDELWVLTWYPSNPVGFYTMMACDLGALLQAANEVDGE